MSTSFNSKLPSVGVSIFTEMTQLANRYQAINLSQGFPDFTVPKPLKEAIKNAIDSDHNQYAQSFGHPLLVEQIGALVERVYSAKIDPEAQVTVTSGATEALWCAVQAIVKPGDEVIIFDPAYDAYQPMVELAGGKCVRLELAAPEFQIDWQQVESMVNSATRAIIINSPHNPTATVLSNKDLLTLSALINKHNLLLISDEVYEFITFDGLVHQSVLRHKQLAERAVVVSSFGKTFHATGWKIGYCIAPSFLATEIRKIHQFVTFCSFTPAQIALATMLKNHSEHIEQLSHFYQSKRDYFCQALSNSRLTLYPSRGTYFVLANFNQISELGDKEFCQWLTKEKGVAAIPLSPFYQIKESSGAHQTARKMADAKIDTEQGNTASNKQIIRLCFAKPEVTLAQAADILCQI